MVSRHVTLQVNDLFLDILTSPYFSIKQVIDHGMHCQLNLLNVAVDVCVAETWIKIMVH